MAVPQTMTTLDLSGKYVMNKALSDDMDGILQLQGVGWLIRKAIRIATLNLYCKHYRDDAEVEHIDVDQTLSGVKGTAENRPIDWVERSDYDHVFGPVMSKTKRIRVDELEDSYLKEGWLDETKEHGVILIVEQSDTTKGGLGWLCEQVWGFETMNGERRHTRRIRFVGPKGEKVHARTVLDYQGAL